MKTFISTIVLLSVFAFNEYVLAQQSYQLPKPVTQVHNQMKVCILPQVELISVVQTISKYPSVFPFLMAKDSSSYKTKVLNHFKPFENHEAVQMFNRLSLQPRMLNFNAPSFIMLHTGENLQIRTNIEPDNFVIQRAGGTDSLKVFLNHLRDFAEKSAFNQFYNEYIDYYAKLTEKTIGNLGPTDFVAELENFYGIKQKSYNIVLVSLYNHVGFGNSIVCADGKREIYNVMGPKNIDGGIPFFGDENYLKYLIRHEFSHPFVNPLTEKHWDFIKEYSENYDSIPEVARKNVCGDWQECINEFTIRAITTHLAIEESETTGKAASEKEKSRGVSNLDKLLESIRFYEMNREKYPTFDSYYLSILDVFIEK